LVPPDLSVQVRCVVACGFVHAHEEENVKVLLKLKGPHANLKKLLVRPTNAANIFLRFLLFHSSARNFGFTWTCFIIAYLSL
jgi:hypothetical protein